MFSAVPEAERDAITVIVFIATFFVSLGIGRFLKRRAGVRLGLLFRLFSLIVAFYAAIAVYGVHAPWRHHVGAAAILLSTALIVALVNRYVWDFYFEKKRQRPIPHFLREVAGGIIFLIVVLFILSYGYHAETQLKGLLAGSGVVAIILGFAGQNLFWGISLHLRNHVLHGQSFQDQRDQRRRSHKCLVRTQAPGHHDSFSDSHIADAAQSSAPRTGRAGRGFVYSTRRSTFRLSFRLTTQSPGQAGSSQHVRPRRTGDRGRLAGRLDVRAFARRSERFCVKKRIDDSSSEPRGRRLFRRNVAAHRRTAQRNCSRGC